MDFANDVEGTTVQIGRLVGWWLKNGALNKVIGDTLSEFQTGI
jgi:hypothetical protein